MLGKDIVSADRSWLSQVVVIPVIGKRVREWEIVSHRVRG